MLSCHQIRAQSMPRLPLGKCFHISNLQHVSDTARQARHLPMIAAINLFVHVLKDPLSATSGHDIALLDVLSGHFGHLEYACSLDASFSAVRELANIARRSVKTSRQQQQ